MIVIGLIVTLAIPEVFFSVLSSHSLAQAFQSVPETREVPA